MVYTAAIFEASSGNWKAQHQRQFFDHEATARLDPLTHLDSWRDIPVLAVHSRRDEWVRHEGQATFLDALRARAADPAIIESLDFDETGAPHEHLGFGRRANEARTREIDFLSRRLA